VAESRKISEVFIYAIMVEADDNNDPIQVCDFISNFIQHGSGLSAINKWDSPTVFYMPLFGSSWYERPFCQVFGFLTDATLDEFTELVERAKNNAVNKFALNNLNISPVILLKKLEMEWLPKFPNRYRWSLENLQLACDRAADAFHLDVDNPELYSETGGLMLENKEWFKHLPGNIFEPTSFANLGL